MTVKIFTPLSLIEYSNIFQIRYLNNYLKLWDY